MPTRLTALPATVNPERFQRDLLRWYRRHRRDLPWRHTQDPYRIWVSEIMLQQTRVDTVIPYYRRWIRAFPTVHALARTPYQRVLKLWEGLGYYQRARNLHLAAKQIAGESGPFKPGVAGAPPKMRRTVVPSSVSELEALPGIGRYTAGAIASIAFGQRAPVVDGNVARVFARVFGRTGNEWMIAESLLPSRRCGEFNQGLMDLGAMVCLPVNPRCSACPLCRVCVTRGDALPVRQRRRMRNVMQEALFIHRGGRILLRQRPPTGMLAGMWEMPAGRSSRQLLTLRHSITDQRIVLQVFAGRNGAGRWFTRRQLKTVPMPTAHRRALDQLLKQAAVGRRPRQ